MTNFIESDLYITPAQELPVIGAQAFFLKHARPQLLFIHARRARETRGTSKAGERQNSHGRVASRPSAQGQLR